MFHWRNLVAVIVGAAIVLGNNSKALAVLYAYEGFNYNAGSALAGLAGGTGWDLPANDPIYTKFVTSAGWQGMTRNNASIEAIGADAIQAGSLTYTDTAGNSLTTSGGYLLNTGSNGTNSQGGRYLSQRRDSGTTWISFMIQRAGADDGVQTGGLYPRGANLALFDQASTDGTTGTDHEAIDIGPNNSNVFLNVGGVDQDYYQLRIPTVNAALTEANLPNAATNRPTSNTNGTRQVQDGFAAVNRQNLNFYVMRIDHLGTSADGDDVRIWMNPRLDQTPSNSNVSLAYIHADIMAAATTQAVAAYTAYPAQGTPAGGTADTSVGDQSFNRIRLFAGNANASPFAELKIDEIRVGSTYADVAPFAPGGVSGDYNQNNVVDAADYVLWRNGGPLQNDPTPGVQPADYDFWKSRFGATSGAGSGSVLGVNVPEPATWIGCMVACGGWWTLGRRRWITHGTIASSN